LESRALLSPIRDKKLRKKAHSNRKPNRNDKLPGVSARKLHIEATTTNLSNPIIEEDERELCTKMIEWTSKTKDTLELMLV
jgi:hypothetical protein